MTAERKIRVLVVDDSALIRSVLSAIINASGYMEVVATAAHPLLARERIRELKPDVLTLDIEMPHMSGLEFLERLMVAHPMPVLMVSTLTEDGSASTLRALELGAVDFIAKPRLGVAQGLQAYAEEICEKLRIVAAARVVGRAAKAELATHAPRPARSAGAAQARVAAHRRVIAVGASTGGTEAIRILLQQLPADCPGIVIAQHMPENFTRSFARRLDSLTDLRVCEAEDGQPILPGHVFVAPGHSHLRVREVGGRTVTEVVQTAPVNLHRPSVDVLFDSVAEVVGARAMGVILTGMGRDGAAGMLRMRKAGAATFAQDERSCVVFGMPREAIALGGAEAVVPLDQMGARLMERVDATY